MESLRRLTPATLFVISAALAVVFLAIANFKDDTGNGGTGPYIFSVVASVLVAALVLFRLWDRLIARPAHWGFVLGIVAFLSCVVFWLGVPFALGVPAIGIAAHDTEGQTRAKAGLVLGALGVVLGAVGCLIG
jgi:hypothetical protein